MKRSQINSYIKKAEDRFNEFKITLPWFAYLKPEDWQNVEGDVSQIKNGMLGWDVTDFCSGDFHTTGAVLFTVRNGDNNDKEMKRPYCEKYIVLDECGQEIPLHYHLDKTEDIINRAGGILIIELYHRTADDKLDMERPITVFMDGVYKTFKPGEQIEVMPGNSITLEPYVFHRFIAKKGAGTLIVGEVSKVNDDNNDNVFYNPLGRFSDIEEDETPVHLLVNEYNF